MAKILLVEDNELNRDMLSRRLRRRGYEVVIAIDGAEGVSMAMSENPDLILMDMSLPIMNGWEATQTLKSDTYTHSIPIIALTAHAMVGEREKALAAGCDDYDTKPVDLKQLLQKIETLLTRPFISSEPPLEKAMSTVVQGVEQPVISGMVEQVDRFESPEKVAPIASQAVEQLAIPGIVEQADQFESPEKVTPIASQA
ncbi:MAG: response regulator, partial [Pseudanabaenales cyanobacterium]|nr:response regulator [Pseudanabaenales cyanobacterium]